MLDALYKSCRQLNYLRAMLQDNEHHRSSCQLLPQILCSCFYEYFLDFFTLSRAPVAFDSSQALFIADISCSSSDSVEKV